MVGLRRVLRELKRIMKKYENPEEKAVESLSELIKKLRNEIEVDVKDDSVTIKCTCRQCQNTIDISKSHVYRSKFFRCNRCGYVVGPIVNHLPRMYWYVVYDETNSVEPQKWFGDEQDAIDYIEFCGLSKDQIRKIYVWTS